MHIVVVDPHRPGHERAYHPGETNLHLADIVIINKVDTASYRDVLTVRASVQSLNPKATILEAASPIFVDDPRAVRGKRVLVIEDGPTLTHGEMGYGAGFIAAQRFGASEIIDPRPFAVGSIRDTYARYTTTGAVLPAMGYSAEQITELEATINQSHADLVLIATPVDLSRVLRIQLPSLRVRYELQIIGTPTLADLLAEKWGRTRTTT
jgi:predicted GTPase